MKKEKNKEELVKVVAIINFNEEKNGKKKLITINTILEVTPERKKVLMGANPEKLVCVKEYVEETAEEISNK